MKVGDTQSTNGVIRGGRMIDPSRNIDCVQDVAIRDGRLVEPAADDGTADMTIDARGLIVCPGLIDMHVHLREPGGEHKETIETGTSAAVAGGFTAVACMPNTTPAIDNEATLRSVIERARLAGHCNVHPIAAITMGRSGERLVDIAALKNAGAVAFSDDGDGVEDDRVMREALEAAKRIDGLLIQHCEFKSMSAGGVMHKGDVARRIDLPGIDPAAEEAMIERDIRLVRETGGRYHVAHISTAAAIELVRQAKREQLPVTAEVCTHHLVLTDDACADQDPNTKMHPPLRGKADVEACRAGLCDGTIDCIVTDHAPHAEEEKNVGFRRAPFGIVGLETALGLAVVAMMDSGLSDWPHVIRWMSAAPASILGVPGGSLEPGAAADITIVDPRSSRRVDPGTFRSKSKNSPFGGWSLPARPVITLVHGRVAYAHESFVNTITRRD